MGANILVTGAAGYIGGSIVADFLASDSTLIKNSRVSAVVRSEEQANTLSKLGINVLQIDLSDEKAVVGSVIQSGINIVIHCASSLNPSLPLNLITALGKQKELSGEHTHFIHTSGLSAFYKNTGWLDENIKDSGPVFEMEKQLAESFPIRKTDVAVIEHAETLGVNSYIVVPSTVYGKGTGEWNQLSVVLPICIASSISRKAVSKFPENVKNSGVHISDLIALYGNIVEKILKKETIPSGKRGYYFAIAHEISWWEFLDHLAAALKARGIVEDAVVQTYPNNEAAAEALGVPEKFVQVLWNSGENVVPENKHKIGWTPKWDKEQFLKNVDVDVQTVLELGKAKSSLIDSLFQAAKA